MFEVITGFAFGWLIIGLVSTFIAIKDFRSNRSNIKTKELYMAAIGPFLGPIILVLYMIDKAKKTT